MKDRPFLVITSPFKTGDRTNGELYPLQADDNDQSRREQVGFIFSTPSDKHHSKPKGLGTRRTMRSFLFVLIRHPNTVYRV